MRRDSTVPDGIVCATQEISDGGARSPIKAGDIKVLRGWPGAAFGGVPDIGHQLTVPAPIVIENGSGREFSVR
jgi:hypothetical protein